MRNHLFVSANAHCLIDPYRDLINKKNIGECPYDDGIVKVSRQCVWSAMPAKGYNIGAVGYVTFVSLHHSSYQNLADPLNPVNRKHTLPFHTAWIADTIDDIRAVFANGCTDCLAKPFVFPFPKEAQNHVFEVLLVPVSIYQRRRCTTTTFSDNPTFAPSGILSDLAISPNDIQEIGDVCLEASGGYMNRNIVDSYNRESSSVGIICYVLLKNGRSVPCYVFNNYDEGALVWKIKK